MSLLNKSLLQKNYHQQHAAGGGKKERRAKSVIFIPVVEHLKIGSNEEDVSFYSSGLLSLSLSLLSHSPPRLDFVSLAAAFFRHAA